MNSFFNKLKFSDLRYNIAAMLIIALCCAAFIPRTAISAEPDKTSENIQKKTIIIKYPSATLFKQASGDAGDEISFMQIYFMMKPEMNGRVPVSKSPGKTGEPDGWLAKDSFTEWNTVQMIQLEPQSGRRLAKVFETQECAVLFGKNGEVDSNCKEIGNELSFCKTKEIQRLLIPVFAKDNNVFQGGFIRVGDVEKGDAEFSAPKFLKKYNLESYESLIIKAELQDATHSTPEFVKGWIQGNSAVSEFILMDKSQLTDIINIFDNIEQIAGQDAFLEILRNIFTAYQLKIKSEQKIDSGESLSDILDKVNTLPFKTPLFSFTAQEISSWKTSDYQRINTILKDKVKVLRELSQNVFAIHTFGEKPYLYVPRAFLP